jgi:arginyl-tRNA--protein-N-Asp/Glu arginylyltransferase
MEYLHWNEKTIADFSPENISAMYDAGYVFTRIGKGVMHQTRSIRIDLSRFELSSENRRVLKKAAIFIHLNQDGEGIHYTWEIAKMAKDFYEEKFGPGIMTANKVKELLTDQEKSNFNYLIGLAIDKDPVAYTICYKNNQIIHYSYPFYDVAKAPKDTGLGMMLMAIGFAKDNGLKYVYLGSLQRPTDTYKLQFAGLEWFDGKKWSTDLEEVKKILKK